MKKLLAALCLLPSYAAADETLWQALRDELARQQQELRLPDAPAPYFIDYTLYDQDNFVVSASLSAITKMSQQELRTLRTSLRVGDATLDQSSYLGQEGAWRPIAVQITPENNYDVLRHELWVATDVAYKNAVSLYADKLASLPNTPSAIPSFAPAPVVKKSLPPLNVTIDEALWKKRAQSASEVFLAYPSFLDSYVTIALSSQERYQINTEGTEIYEPRLYAQIYASITVQTQDGGRITDTLKLSARSVEGLPSDEALRAELKRFAENMLALEKASTFAEEYSGPVIFEGIAAGQMLEEVLLPQLSGAPPVENDNFGFYGKSAWLRRIGKRVLPNLFTMWDDPTNCRYQSQDLIGCYVFDEEGVASQKVDIFEKGSLRSLLSSRTPSKSMPQSNGHGRGVMSSLPNPQIGVLYLQASTLSSKDLYKKAFSILEKSDPFIIVVRRLQRSADGSAFPSPDEYSREEGELSLPVEFYKVYRDGHEERVIGASIQGVNRRTLEDLLAIGNTPSVYNFFDTRHAGFFETSSSIPMSIVSPSLLFSDLALDVKSQDSSKPLILRNPRLGEKK